jgi:hypothetical protein
MEDRNRKGSRRRQYLWTAFVLIVGLGAGALVHAAVPHAFVANETLTAANLNSNFNALDTRTTTLETNAAGAFNVLESASDVNQTGAASADVVYTSVSVTLTAGTWLVEAFASVSTNVIEGVELGLFDVTNGADIPNARGGVAQTVAGGNVALHTDKVITVTVPTTIKMKGYRNGASILSFGYGSVLAAGRNRLMAIRLK